MFFTLTISLGCCSYFYFENTPKTCLKTNKKSSPPFIWHTFSKICLLSVSPTYSLTLPHRFCQWLLRKHNLFFFFLIWISLLKLFSSLVERTQLWLSQFPHSVFSCLLYSSRFFHQFTCCITFKLRSRFPKVYKLDLDINFTKDKFFKKFYIVKFLSDKMFSFCLLIKRGRPR